MRSLITSILTVLMFVLPYPVLCLLFPRDPEDNNDWWHWRIILFVANLILLGYVALMNKSFWAIFTIECFIGICFSDVFDRVLFDERHYELNDIVGVIVTFAVVYWRKRKEICLRKKK